MRLLKTLGQRVRNQTAVGHNSTDGLLVIAITVNGPLKTCQLTTWMGDAEIDHIEAIFSPQTMAEAVDYFFPLGRYSPPPTAQSSAFLDFLSDSILECIAVLGRPRAELEHSLDFLSFPLERLRGPSILSRRKSILASAEETLQLFGRERLAEFGVISELLEEQVAPILIGQLRCAALMIKEKPCEGINYTLGCALNRVVDNKSAVGPRVAGWLDENLSDATICQVMERNRKH